MLVFGLFEVLVTYHISIATFLHFSLCIHQIVVTLPYPSPRGSEVCAIVLLRKKTMKITIIGAGAMGGAMAEGLLECGRFMPQDITVSDHNQPVLDHFAEKGANVNRDNQLACQEADIVCVVVKPWCVEKTLKGIRDVLDYDKQKLIVVAAGVPSADIKQWLDKNGETPVIFLVMPNIAIAYRQSMTFITPIDASDEDIKTIVDIFDELGESLIMEELLFPAATAMSCAIAYAMRYVRANVEGGVEMGFKAKDAQKIVLQTVKGAIQLLQATGEHPEAAIDKVTTPGGCTIRGLNTMEQGGFTAAVINGLLAGKR